MRRKYEGNCSQMALFSMKANYSLFMTVKEQSPSSFQETVEELGGTLLFILHPNSSVLYAVCRSLGGRLALSITTPWWDLVRIGCKQTVCILSMSSLLCSCSISLLLYLKEGILFATYLWSGYISYWPFYTINIYSQRRWEANAALWMMDRYDVFLPFDLQKNTAWNCKRKSSPKLTQWALLQSGDLNQSGTYFSLQHPTWTEVVWP